MSRLITQISIIRNQGLACPPAFHACHFPADALHRCSHKSSSNGLSRRRLLLTDASIAPKRDVYLGITSNTRRTGPRRQSQQHQRQHARPPLTMFTSLRQTYLPHVVTIALLIAYLYANSGSDDAKGVEEVVHHVEAKPKAKITIGSMLVDTDGYRVFRPMAEGSLSDTALRNMPFYVPYCYETTVERIEKHCARVALMPDASPVGPAERTVPVYFELKESTLFPGRGLHTKVNLKAGLIFGPYTGPVVPDGEQEWSYSWTVSFHPRGHGQDIMYVDGKDEASSNYIRWVNSCRWLEEQDFFQIEQEGAVYYLLIRDIKAGQELLTYYGYDYLSHYDYEWKEGFREQVMGLAPARKYIDCVGEQANCVQPPSEEDVQLSDEWLSM